ncbi:MAG: adenylate/guanylate cyclase domain-containing protein [Cyclobacteriaceae bacterium]|nr:adenylate/guanylate cyclase domain-containing protein [Cyclobacteriaceae bacterium]
MKMMWRALRDCTYSIGEYYLMTSEPGIAAKYFSFAANAAHFAENTILEARSLFNQANAEKAMARSGNYSLEEEQEYYRKSIKTYQRAHAAFQEASMAGCYEDVQALIEGGDAAYILGDYEKAIKPLEIALREAQKKRYDELGLRASDILAQSYAGMNDSGNQERYRSVYAHYQEYFISLDSLNETTEEIQKLESSNARQQVELDKKQMELKQINLELENQLAIAEKNEAIIRQHKLERKMMVGGIVVVVLILVVAVVGNEYKRRINRKLASQNRMIIEQKIQLEVQQKDLKAEKGRTDSLLRNILPEPVAEELKKFNKVTPRYYPKVTVMFTDFKGFAEITSQMTPGEIVKELDDCFAAFDQIIEKYEAAVGRKCVEKIKTMGDGYMCAGGVPFENVTNPIDIVEVALAFVAFMEQRKREKLSRDLPWFGIRIGINTGPVVAGVVGSRKFAYDIWGNTVNIASRMESACEPGMINISASTFQHIQGRFSATPRGKIAVKNKGEFEMYYIEGRVGVV